MTAFFDRAAKVTIFGNSGEPVLGYDDDGLRMLFRIKKTATPTPNFCELSIYNLSQNTRSRLHEKQDTFILEAGYKDALFQIFKGKLLLMNSSRSSGDWLTVLQLTDGNARENRVTLCLGPGTSFKDAVLAVADATGLDKGNLEDKLKSGSPRKMVSYKKGFVVSGGARRALERMVESAGWEFSVQDGVIQVLEPKEPRPQNDSKEIPLISSNTGMIDSPNLAENQTITVRSLLRPDIIPKDRIRIESENIKGDYTVHAIGHMGDTFGQEWYSDIECQLKDPEQAAGV